MKRTLAIIPLILIFSIATNVVLHEGAHFFVAESMHLDPSVRITGYSEYKQAGFLSPSVALATVEYTSKNPLKDALVAAAGPLANFALAGFGLTNLKKKKSLTLIIFIAISFLSGALNLMPFWSSDGAQVFGFLTKAIS